MEALLETNESMESLRDSSEKNQTYTPKEVLEACLKYFDQDELAATTWMNKYALKNSHGDYLELNPDAMHRRMAKQFGRIEKKYDDSIHLNGSASLLSSYGQSRKALDTESIYEMFKDFNQIIPQGSVMASLGNPYRLASLSNCIVMPSLHDSYGGVFLADQQLAQLFKRRCGVGIDISGLRPAGASVSNSAGTTTGAASFMERFSNTTREVAQNGRRGALMLTMDIAHPDIEEFITKKQDLSKVTGANVSIRLSDEFMHAVDQNTEYTHQWPIDSSNPTFTKTIKAKELWNIIIKCAHQTAEPGLIFWDRQHKYSTSSVYPEFKNVSTNPCSEIAMQGGDSCRLIALNLFNFVNHPFTSKANFDTKKFYETTYEAQRLMDDLVDLELEAVERILEKINNDPEPDMVKQVEKETWQLLYETGKKGRRTGLGFTALADTIAALGLSFDSDEAISEIEKLMKLKASAEFDSSIDMAISRGAFESFDKKIEDSSEFVQMLKKELPTIYKRMMKHGRRNISISTVASTGTLSMLAQTSSGIEPVFMLSYKRRRKLNPEDKNAKVDFVDDLGDSWEEFVVYHNKLKYWMNTTGLTDETKSPYAGSTANEIDWKKRVKMQSVVQKYVTHSISSTINLAADVSEQEVGDIYLESWKQGLKGITVYRDGSRSGILISNESKKDDSLQTIIDSVPPPRPKKLDAEIVRFQNNHEKWIAVVGILNGKPYEIFTGNAEESFFIPSYISKGKVIKKKSKSNSNRYDFQYLDQDGYKVTIEGLSRSFNKEFWNYAKLISGVLRHGMPIPFVVHLIENLNLDDQSINTWRNGVIRALKKFIPNGTQAADHKCPECNDPDGLVYEEGCLTCKSCGHSKCG